MSIGSLSETVAFAAEAFEGTLTELYKPKRGRHQPHRDPDPFYFLPSML